MKDLFYLLPLIHVLDLPVSELLSLCEPKHSLRCWGSTALVILQSRQTTEDYQAFFIRVPQDFLNNLTDEIELNSLKTYFENCNLLSSSVFLMLLFQLRFAFAIKDCALCWNLLLCPFTFCWLQCNCIFSTVGIIQAVKGNVRFLRGRGSLLRHLVLIQFTQGQIEEAFNTEGGKVRLNGLSQLHLGSRTSDCDAISSRNSLVRRRYKGPLH